METLLFTGLSATGKSTIAKRLANDLGFILFREREILHELAVARGYNRTREWITKEGEGVVLRAATAETIAKMQGITGDDGFVVDGSYDKYLPLVLKTAFPNSRVTVIHITLEDQEREKRISGRLGVSIDIAKKEMGLIDGFKRRAGIGEIIKAADITIKNDRLVENALDQVISGLEFYGIVSGVSLERR